MSALSATPAALRLTVDIDGLLIDGHVSLWYCWGCHVHTAVRCEVVPKDPLQKGTRHGGGRDLEVSESQRNKIKGKIITAHIHSLMIPHSCAV